MRETRAYITYPKRKGIHTRNVICTSALIFRKKVVDLADILTDTSKTALKSVSEEHFFDSLRCFSVVPDVELYEGENTMILSPGIPNWLTNAVFRCRISADDVDTVIDATNESFYSKGLIPRWQLCPGDLPSDLEEHLTRKGFTLEAKAPAMAVDLEKVNQHIGTPNGFVIEHITDAATMKEKHIIISKFGSGKSFGSLLMDLFSAYGFDTNSDWQHYIGVLNGKPVACSSVFYATGVAGIYMVSTLPEARRQGIGSAITLQALLDARERGYGVGMLQSSEMGYNVYRRLGFETCFKIKTYAPIAAQA